MGGLVWLASYPKSGNTWMRAFLANLLIDTPEPVPINHLAKFCLGESARIFYEGAFDKPLDEVSVSEIARLRPQVQESLTRFSVQPVFVKTHNYMGTWFDVPLINLKVTAAAIYVARNPLDVAISCSHHFGETIDESIKRLSIAGSGTKMSASHVPEIYHTWSHNVDSWALHPNPRLLPLRYEDLVAQPELYFGRVVRFLGINLPEERFRRALRHSSFDILKDQEKEQGFLERPKTSQSFFREGRAEQWRDVLSPEQVRQIIHDHRATMERLGYIPKDYA